MNWLWVALLSFLVYGSIIVYCLRRKRWTRGGLGVALVNLLIVFMNSVAPIRGWVDPNYLGFSVGFIRVAPGAGVTLVSGAFFVGALACACIALLDKMGKPMLFVALFDGLFALNMGSALLVGLVRSPEQIRIQLGEYLTIPPLPATLVSLGLFVLPLVASALWAARRRT